jgi:hypothetical protein
MIVLIHHPTDQLSSIELSRTSARPYMLYTYEGILAELLMPPKAHRVRGYGLAEVLDLSLRSAKGDIEIHRPTPEHKAIHSKRLHLECPSAEILA